MEWFHCWGLIFIVAIMIPNILFAIRYKDGFENQYKNKPIEILEQIGRFGCFGFIIFHIPGICWGWWSDRAFTAYLIVDALLIILYCILWIVCWKKNTVFKALALSIIPSVVFLFSGVMSRSLLLIVSSLLFAPTHIFISYQNAK